MDTTTLLPVAAAGAASAFIGWIWYHPRVFGTAWMRMSNITPEMAERGKKRMPIMAILGLIASIVAAWVMYSVGIALGIYDWVGAIIDLALWLWVGFVATTLLGQVLWDQKPFRLYLINAGYWLVSFVVMAVILFH